MIALAGIVMLDGMKCWILLAMTGLLAASEHIGDIEFYGYKGIDVAALRKTLPVHEGDPYSDSTKKLVADAVLKAIGKPPTEVAAICCDEQQNMLLFIGIPGGSYRKFAYNDAPKGNARLSAAMLELSSRIDHALEAAVRKGGEGTQEDDSQGYALIQDPATRALQLQERAYALAHEGEILRALESSDVEQRRVASDALGYAQQSHRQILALVRAARDPDDDVRNNATRALGVLARSNPKIARQIPPDPFIAMLNSGIWTDRNKGAFVLAALTADRDQAVLTKLRVEALDALIEMAKWRRAAHAYNARVLLGRVASPRPSTP
jgi:hypothetical protein